MTKLISMDKQYKTRDGRSVRILCVDREDSSFPVVALVADENDDDLAIYTADGSFFRDGTQHRLDLIEVSQWDFPIDTPVLVRDADDQEWSCRHFAGVDDEGVPLAYVNGTTSWTANHKNDTVRWKQCKAKV